MLRMKRNVGGIDRGLRIAVGLAIGAAGVWFKDWVGLMGIWPILTAVFGFCPMYVPFGLSSCRRGKA
jgi:hypothetical protein